MHKKIQAACRISVAAVLAVALQDSHALMISGRPAPLQSPRIFSEEAFAPRLANQVGAALRPRKPPESRRLRIQWELLTDVHSVMLAPVLLQRYRFEGNAEAVSDRCLAVHPTEPWVAMVTGPTIRVLNLHTDQQIDHFEAPNTTSIVWGSGHELLFTDGSEHFYSKTIIPDSNKPVSDAVAQQSKNKRRIHQLVFVRHQQALDPSDTRIVVLQEGIEITLGGKQRAEIELRMGKPIHAFAVHPKLHSMVYANDNEVHLLPIQEEFKDQVLVTLDQNVRHLAYSPDGTILAIGARGNVLLMNLENHRKVLIQETAAGSPAERELRMFDLHPSNQFIAIGRAAGVVELWNIQDIANPSEPSFVFRSANDGEGVKDLQFSPDGRFLYLVGDREFQIWGLTTNTLSAVPIEEPISLPQDLRPIGGPTITSRVLAYLNGLPVGVHKTAREIHESLKGGISLLQVVRAINSLVHRNQVVVWDQGFVHKYSLRPSRSENIPTSSGRRSRTSQNPITSGATFASVLCFFLDKLVLNAPYRTTRSILGKAVGDNVDQNLMLGLCTLALVQSAQEVGERRHAQHYYQLAAWIFERRENQHFLHDLRTLAQDFLRVKHLTPQTQTAVVAFRQTHGAA